MLPKSSNIISFPTQNYPLKRYHSKNKRLYTQPSHQKSIENQHPSKNFHSLIQSNLQRQTDLGTKNQKVSEKRWEKQQLLKKIKSFRISNEKSSFRITDRINLNKNIINSKQISSSEKLKYFFLTDDGWRINNEDRISVENNICIKGIKYEYFAIFDGHGGSQVSQYLAANAFLILKVYMQQHDPKQALRLCLQECERKTIKKRNTNSGSCALICLISNKKCWIANVGDSRAIQIDQNLIFSQITTDHKPENETQRARIQKLGGHIYRNLAKSSENKQHQQNKPWRVYPGQLSISRAIGDGHIKRFCKEKILSAQCDVFEVCLDKVLTILLFSDGLYQKLSNSEIASFYMTNDASQGTKKIFEEAMRRQSSDNRSVIAIQFK